MSVTLNKSVFQDILQPPVPGEFSFLVCLKLEDILEQVHRKRQHLIVPNGNTNSQFLATYMAHLLSNTSFITKASLGI